MLLKTFNPLMYNMAPKLEYQGLGCFFALRGGRDLMLGASWSESVLSEFRGTSRTEVWAPSSLLRRSCSTRECYVHLAPKAPSMHISYFSSKVCKPCFGVSGAPRNKWFHNLGSLVGGSRIKALWHLAANLRKPCGSPNDEEHFASIPLVQFYVPFQVKPGDPHLYSKPAGSSGSLFQIAPSAFPNQTFMSGEPAQMSIQGLPLKSSLFVPP